MQKAFCIKLAAYIGTKLLKGKVKTLLAFKRPKCRGGLAGNLVPQKPNKQQKRARLQLVQKLRSCSFKLHKARWNINKIKQLAVAFCMALLLYLAFSTMAFSTETGDVTGAIEGIWTTASPQIQTVVNQVMFPEIHLILAVFFFAKLGTAYFSYQKPYRI